MNEHPLPNKRSKVLVTGFDRFGHLKRPNASSEIALPAIEQEYGELVETLVLPTARDIAAEQLSAAIEDINPVAVVMFGISAGRKVRLELRAKNVGFNVLVPDNNGVRKFGRIDNDGPKNLASTLPLDDIYARLKASHVPTRFSSDAGTFICNEVMYKALQHTDSSQGESLIPTGFIHLGNGLHDQLVEEASLLVVDELINFENR